jgi:CRISPR-associated protein Cas2
VSELYIVVAYDTPSDRRRAGLARLLKGFGERRQFSLFECRLRREQWATLKGKLERLVVVGEDRLAVYFLSPEALGRTLRVGNEPIKPLDEPEII